MRQDSRGAGFRRRIPPCPQRTRTRMGPPASASTLKDDVGEGLVGGVSKGEVDISGAEAGGDFRGGAVEGDGGALSFGTDDFDIAPTDTMVPSGAEGFHAGFFGGKTG